MKIILLSTLLLLLMGCGGGAPVVSQPPVEEAGIKITDQLVIESDGMYNSTPSVIEAANGDWVLTYLKGTGHVSSSTVIMRRSQDLGKTWSPEAQYFDTSKPDPSLARTPKGDLFVSLVKQDSTGVNGAAYSRSQNNGLTWGSFRFLGDPVNAVFAFGASPVRDHSTMFGLGYDAGGATLWNSTDDGYTWINLSSIGQLSDAPINETAIAKVEPGRILAISRDSAITNTWGHFSDDLGRTWNAQIDYTSQIGVLQAPELLQVRNVLLLFGRQWDYVKLPHELVVFASYDGGSTFTDRTVLDTYTGLAIDGGYCWPLLRSDGNVFVVYYADSNNLEKPDIKSLVVHWNKTKSE
jgi:Neuraminidase (sialidase)